jgi:hypothetical protein
VEFIRSLYQMALQIANRESSSSSVSALGKIYRKVIDLSSNKEMALEVITQVVQQLQLENISTHGQSVISDFNNSGANSNQMNIDEDEQNISNNPLTIRNGMAVEDINNIFCISYNSGVTLVDLGQVALAKDFFDQASILLNYTSHSQSSMWANFLKDAKKVFRLLITIALD